MIILTRNLEYRDIKFGGICDRNNIDGTMIRLEGSVDAHEFDLNLGIGRAGCGVPWSPLDQLARTLSGQRCEAVTM
jgi:hypothetical protein